METIKILMKSNLFVGHRLSIFFFIFSYSLLFTQFLTVAKNDFEDKQTFRQDLIQLNAIVHDTVQSGKDYIRVSIGELLLRNKGDCQHTRTVPHEGRELCKIWECRYTVENFQFVDWVELDTSSATTPQVHLISTQIVTPHGLNVTIKDCDQSSRCDGTSVLDLRGLDTVLLSAVSGSRSMYKIMIDELRPVVQELLRWLVLHELQAAIQKWPCGGAGG